MIQFKMGMKLPGGAVYEVAGNMSALEMNLAVDGHATIYRKLMAMVDSFMEGLPREKDAK